MCVNAQLKAQSRPSPKRTGNDARRAAPLSVNRSRSRPWFWRFMLVLGIALAIDFLVDDKLIFAGIALIWMLACLFTLSRLKRSRHVP